MKRIALGGLFALAACSNAGSNLGFAPTALKNINLLAFLDRDASGSLGTPDTVYGGARISLRPSGGGQAIQTVTTGPGGLSALVNIPVGDYLVTVDSASLGDTVTVAAISPDRVRLSASTETAISVNVRLSYYEFSIRAARQAAPGRRALIKGIVLAGVQSFRDTTSYVQDTSGQIRLTRVSLRGGLTGNNPGDSVIVLGTVSSRAGQPTLDRAIITLAGTRPAPIPFSVTTATAASAMSGVLDAALVQVTGAIISDTGAVGPDFQVIGSDGSGPLTVILDAFGGFNRQAFVPGRPIIARGVLVPNGTGQWVLKPRNAGDVGVF